MVSLDWIASKKATINPKNEKYYECFKCSIIGGLNYNKINEKELKKIEKKGLLQIFHHTTENGKKLKKKQKNFSCEEIKLAYKVNYNKRKNQVILLMISNSYYVAIKKMSELNSLGWLRGKKEPIINNDNSFQSALDDALNYQTIKTNPERISKLKPYINKHNWKGIEFLAGPKDWIKFEQINKTIALNILFIPHNTKTLSVAYRSEYSNK